MIRRVVLSALVLLTGSFTNEQTTAAANAQAQVAPVGARKIGGTLWVVDAFEGDPLPSAPHRQGGVQLELGANGRIFGLTHADAAGRWTYTGTPPQIVTAAYRTADPAQPAGAPLAPGDDPYAHGWLNWAGWREPMFPVDTQPLTMDLTLWQYEGPGHRLAIGCQPDHLEFTGGLLALAYVLGDVMGQPLECEHVGTPAGDVIQATSTGLGYQFAHSDQYIFTDGKQSWVLMATGEAQALSTTEPLPGGRTSGPLSDQVLPDVVLSQRARETVRCAPAASEISGTIWVFDPAARAPPTARAGAHLRLQHDRLDRPLYWVATTGADGTYRAPTMGPGGYVLFLERGDVPGSSDVPSINITLQLPARGDTCRVNIVLATPPPAELSSPLPECGPDSVTELMQPFAALTAALGEPMTRTVDCATLDSQTGETVQRTRGGMAFYRPWDQTLVFTDGWRRWRVTGDSIEELPGADQP